MAEKTPDHEKQVALIVPKWCVNMLLDHLDMQYDALLQEREFYHDIGNMEDHANLKQELELYDNAINQIVGQVDNS